MQRRPEIQHAGTIKLVCVRCHTVAIHKQPRASLLGQKKYAEAEPLLLAGYEGMKQRDDKIPVAGKVRLTEALERLVRLFEMIDKKDEAATWRKKLEEARAAAKEPAKP